MRIIFVSASKALGQARSRLRTLRAGVLMTPCTLVDPFFYLKNAAINNEEHLVLKGARVVETHRGCFDDLWHKGTEVTMEMVTAGRDKQLAAKAAKADKRGPSRSPSVPRSGRHALSVVPEEAAVRQPVRQPVPASPVASPAASPGRGVREGVAGSSPPGSPGRVAVTAAAALPAGSSSAIQPPRSSNSRSGEGVGSGG